MERKCPSLDFAAETDAGSNVAERCVIVCSILNTALGDRGSYALGPRELN
jgi:hypothetical protein